MTQHYTIALAGNPNCGKSTIFNALTGSHQHVGNWPGKTVEKKAGIARLGGHEVSVVDLPGAYSLSAYSAEEEITRDFVVEARPDAVIAVVDATNLERNLYIVLQLMELGAPVILAVNMIDMAKARGIDIDLPALSARLGGIKIVATAARQGTGLQHLRDAIYDVITAPQEQYRFPKPIDYGSLLEDAIHSLEGCAAKCPALDHRYPPRWLAIKLLEGEAHTLNGLNEQCQPRLLEKAAEHGAALTTATDEDAETLIVDRRYSVIGEIARAVVTAPSEEGITPSERIDRVLTHRWLGLPIFLLLMWIVFQMVSNVSAPLLDWVDATINGPVAGWITALLTTAGLGGTWVEALLVEGVIAGVGGVLVFIPVLFFLYLAIALLEDTGYMARAAFVMDRFMHALGLHGKSFLPMLVGFGCTVPAIYATRTLENPDDRKLTAFLTTFMSCGARLPVYVIFGSAFFGTQGGGLIFAMYLVGIGVAVLTGLLLKRTIFKNKPAPMFVLEMPPYRLPTVKSVWLHIWERTSEFVEGVWTTILIASVVIWFLLAFPVGAGLEHFADVPPEQSLFGTLSTGIAPAFAPAGFDHWEATGALVSGFVAKEVVIATFSQVYAVGAEDVVDDGPSPTTFGEDAAAIANSLGSAMILTGQEMVNIVPRTLNLVPGINIPLAVFQETAEEPIDTRLETALRGTFTPLAAVAFNIFVLLYTPCMSSVAAMRQEFGGRWTLFQMLYTFVVAWAAAVIVYQGGMILGFG